MSSISYSQAMNDALERLQCTGYYLDHSFANHAPMAAEALAALGHCDQVAGWVESNLSHRRHHTPPGSNDRIDAGDAAQWRSALGDRRRGGDWLGLFQQEIEERGWPDVLASWWPRLLPGLGGGLTHGLIRTAHAVRGLAASDQPSKLQLDELARGLGFWATVYAELGADSPARADQRQADDVDVYAALSDLTANYAGHYATVAIPHPVPLIHTVTAPAAMRLVLPHLPSGLHRRSYDTMDRVNRSLLTTFGRAIAADAPDRPPEPMDFPVLVAEAVELGDEHAIKICEAAQREHALQPDVRYRAASQRALTRLKRL